MLITEFSLAVTELKILEPHAMQRSRGLWLSRISMDASYNLDLDKIGGVAGGELHLNFRVVVREETEQVEVLDGHSA